MLILTRKPGESLFVGDNIKVTILSLQGKQVKIGLDVPSDMAVYREEIYSSVLEENKAALVATPEDLYVMADLWQEKKN